MRIEKPGDRFHRTDRAFRAATTRSGTPLFRAMLRISLGLGLLVVLSPAAQQADAQPPGTVARRVAVFIVLCP